MMRTCSSRSSTEAAHRLIYVGAYAATFDRAVVPPMLLAIAASYGASVVHVAAVVSTYFLLYGASQVVWGSLSDRFGRVLVIRVALVGTVAGSVASVFAPTLGVLAIARGITGMFLGGLMGASLVYLGETLAPRDRSRGFATLIGTNGFALATGTIIGGSLAYLLSWRLAFLVPAAIAGWVLVAGRGLAEPAGERPRGSLEALSRVVRQPWAVAVIALALLEGFVIHGFITFWAPALESVGWSPVAAGLVISAYGTAALISGRRTAQANRSTLPGQMLAGGAAMTAGYAACAIWVSLPGILLACVLAGAGYVLMHSGLQVWVNEVSPDARAMALALFASMLFVGGAISVSLVAPLAEDDRFGTLFAIAALTSAAIAGCGAGLRLVFERRGAAAIRRS